MRSLAGSAVAACVAVAGALSLAAPATAAPDQATWAQRAVDSYDSLQSRLYLGEEGHDLYLERYPKRSGDSDYSFFWPVREATEATLDLTELPRVGGRFEDDVSDRFTAAGHYWDADVGAYRSYPTAPLGAGAEPYYDDNAIIGLDLVRQYRRTHDTAMLDRAVQVFEFLEGGWDTDPAHACAGGMRWVDASWNSIRAANATSLAAEFAVLLSEDTGSKHVLQWGKRAYEWVGNCLRSSEGLYSNSLGYDGTVDETLWIYNSGAMIGAATLLYQATGDERYLKRAEHDAHAAVTYWTAADRDYEQPAIFDAYFFKNLLLLASVRPDPGYREALANYAERIWARNRDPQTGLLSFQAGGGGAPDPDVRPEALEQSAAVQLFAMLGSKRADYGGPPALDPVRATGVDIVAPDVVAEPYGTVQLSARFTPDDTSYKRVEWSVTEPEGSPTDKAVIDDQGKLTVNHRDGDVLVRAVAADGGGASATKLVRIKLDPRLLRANAARWPGVTATASSAYSDDYRAENVFDGITGQWAVGEWASSGEQNPWIQLDWPKPIQADAVVIYDRSIPEDVNGGTLSFSDGSTVAVSGVPADGKPKTVSFPLKTFSWVKFQVQGGTGANVGLSEIEVRAIPVAPDAPTGVGATGGAREATVSWQPPAFDGGAPLTGYVVTPYRDGEALPPISVGEDTTSVVVPALSPGRSYRFTVAASNLLGTGAASAPTAPITPS